MRRSRATLSFLLSTLSAHHLRRVSTTSRSHLMSCVEIADVHSVMTNTTVVSNDNPFNQSLDALPYYDRDLESSEHQHLRGEINSLLAVELRSLLPKSSNAQPTNLTHLPPPRALPTSSPLLTSELARAQSKKPVPSGVGLDTTRYAMPAPPEGTTDVDAWEQAWRSSLAQLEHQRLRTMNGSLLAQPIGANAWRVQNFALENTIARVEKEVEEEREAVDGLNRRRKDEQEKGGEILTRLEKKWTELVSGNMQLEIGCMTLEAEVAQLQARHAELSQRMQQTA